MRIAIVGSDGQLGSDVAKVFQKYSGFEPNLLTHDDIEITDPISVRNVINKIKPEVIVNCAAFHKVVECEKNVEKAFQVNSLGALNIARICSEIDALCVYISTDYVYDGQTTSPYKETDLTCPVNVYGVSKLAGESLTSQTCAEYLILRVSSLFGQSGSKGKGGNFIEAIIKKAQSDETLKVINDVYISPTYTVDVAEATRDLIIGRFRGVFNVTNSNAGKCTWYTFAKKIIEMIELNNDVEPISAAEYPSVANVPMYSVLDNSKIEKSIGRNIPCWTNALDRYLAEKGYIN